MVVLADEQDRQLPDRREVESFVEGAVVDRPIAEEGDADLIVFQQLEAVAGAGGLQNTWPNDTAGPHQADFRGEQVHAAATAVRAAGGATEQLAEQLTGRHALRQGVSVAAMGAENDIL